MSSTSPDLDLSTGREEFGFSRNQSGGHLARSMMLSELTILAAAVVLEAPLSSYKTAILDDNALGKPTFASRDKSLRHLVQLYGLDPSLALFRVLRRLAESDRESLPLMAMICVFCRDAQLRQSFELVDRLKPGEVLPRERMEEHIEAGFPGRFSAAMKKSLAQNVNTTWTAAGHLAGKATKTRAIPRARFVASTYAMFAGYLFGLRSETLLNSVFARLAAIEPQTAIAHLSLAASRGWLRFRHGGGVTEVDFSSMLTPEEERLLHGAH